MSTTIHSIPPARPIMSSRLPLLGGAPEHALVGRIAELERSEGRSVIRCHISRPDFPLPAHVREAVERALRVGGIGYCDPQGLPALREAIARHAGARRGIRIDPEQVVVVPGGRAPIAFALQAYCDAGDDVVFPSPGYPLFESFAAYVGARPLCVHLTEANGFQFDPDELASRITCWTKLIFLNFPANPTGAVATEAQLERLADAIMAHAPHGVRIYSDESYEDIVYDGRRHVSMASLHGMQERTIIASGVSKSYAWPGGRIGWVILPSVEEARLFRNLNVHYFGSLPPHDQAGAVAALESPLSVPAVARMVDAFQERRDTVLPLLDAVPGVHCTIPGGAFFLFPNVAGLLENVGAVDAWRELPSSRREETSPATLFQSFLLERYGVATMDRRSFVVAGSEGEHYLRVSLAAPAEHLRDAVVRLARAGMDRDGFGAFAQGMAQA